MATFLTPDKLRVEQVGNVSITIKEKIIPDSLVATKDVASHVKKGQKMKPCLLLNDGTGKPKGITVHNTGDISVKDGTTPAEQYTRATYNGNMNGAVVHFYVYKNDIWQMLREDERGWHASDGSTRRTDHRGGKTGGNLDTISIECIGDIEESTETTAKLVAYLCAKYDLDPKLDVYTHNWWMHGTDASVSGAKKNCPIYILSTWSSLFLPTVSTHYNNIKYSDTVDCDMCSYTNTMYNTLNDIPAGEFRDIINKLMHIPAKNGSGYIINGYGDGTLRLSNDMVRMLVINYRAGLYGDIL